MVIRNQFQRLSKIKTGRIKEVVVYHRWLILALFIVTTALVGGWHITRVSASHTVSYHCDRRYGALATDSLVNGDARWVQWRNGSYYYRTYLFALIGDGNAPEGDRINSNPADPNACQRGNLSETVRLDTSVAGFDLRWNSDLADPTGTVYGAGMVRADRAYFGVPRALHNNDGVWRADRQNSVRPYRHPPLMGRNNRRAIAFVDDGGQALINGRHIWCLDIYYSIPSPNAACRPDPYDPQLHPNSTGTPNSWNLAGSLFAQNNCTNFTDTTYGSPYQTLNCADGNFFNWYRFFGTEWYNASGPLLDITSVIDTDNDGTIADQTSFRLQMAAVQTRPGGFGAGFVMTFRYRIPPGQVIVSKFVSAGGPTVDPGDPITYTIQVRRLYPGGIRLSSLTVDDTVAFPFVYSSSSRTANTHPPPGGTGLVRWVFTASEMNAINVPNGVVTFSLTVLADPSIDSAVCGTNTATAYGRDILNNPVSDSDPASAICVAAPRHPYMSTSGGSVHAGGTFGDEPCLLPPTNNPGITTGKIRGRTAGANGSLADFVVSAGNDINSFGSASTASGFDSQRLAFGNMGTLGQYGNLCRPDMFARLWALPNSMPQVRIATTAAEVVSYLTTNSPADLVVKFDGNLTLTTPLTIPNGRHVTLVVRGALLLTRGSAGPGIQYSSGSFGTTHDLPALAIVTSSNIRIHNNIDSLDGIYYAGTTGIPGIIDTCGDSATGTGPNIAVGGGAGSCSRTLRVNGALVAYRILFRRTFGNVNLPTPPAELVVFFPEIYLQPPPGFQGLVAQIRNGGERPAVY